jgi:aspartyl-tRNA(Asn)/glutamyl-tRNA(Gln) amidotransferase subunit C
MEISKETVKYVSHLARIELQDKELDKLSHQLKSILDFIDQLNKADVDKVNPTSHILPISNVLRQDAPCKSLPSDEALLNAPSSQGQFFIVPRIVE